MTSIFAMLEKRLHEDSGLFDDAVQDARFCEGVNMFLCVIMLSSPIWEAHTLSEE